MIMTKEDLAQNISREIFKQKGCIESSNAYECIHSYFFDLSMEDLIGIASQYGIEVE